MNEAELFALYEKIYFNELERKEQIFSRLSIPLAVIIAIAGFYAVIIGGSYKSLAIGGAIWFWVVLGCSVVALLVGGWFFVNSLLGRVDQAIPTANDIEAWRIELLDYYSDQPDADVTVATALRQMMYSAYMNCSTISTLNNEQKSFSLYCCNIALILAAALAVVAYVIETVPKL